LERGGSSVVGRGLADHDQQRCYLHPSSGAQTTVSTASDICHTFTATCLYSSMMMGGGTNRKM